MMLYQCGNFEGDCYAAKRVQQATQGLNEAVKGFKASSEARMTCMGR